MAPSFVHGKGARIYAGNKPIYTILQSIDVDHTCDTPETTVFGNGDRTYQSGGVREADMSFDGFYDGGSSEAQKLIEDALGSTAPTTITYGMGGAATGARARLVTTLPVGFGVQSMATDVVKVTASVKPTSRMDYGVFLLNETAVTTTGSSTAVSRDNGSTAASSNGGVGHFHLIAQSTLTSLVVKVQHSSAAVSWADLITFTAATGITVQRSTVAGTVKRYVRATRSTFTGGAGKSVQAVVAFGRR